jgi:hypothetical protein
MAEENFVEKNDGWFMATIVQPNTHGGLSSSSKESFQNKNKNNNKRKDSTTYYCAHERSCARDNARRPTTMAPYRVAFDSTPIPFEAIRIESIPWWCWYTN